MWPPREAGAPRDHPRRAAPPQRGGARPPHAAAWGARPAMLPTFLGQLHPPAVRAPLSLPPACCARLGAAESARRCTGNAKFRACPRGGARKSVTRRHLGPCQHRRSRCAAPSRAMRPRRGVVRVVLTAARAPVR